MWKHKNTDYSVLFMQQSCCALPSSFPRPTCASVLLTVGGGRGSVGNNLQMKNNPFRSNTISGRADGQPELCSAVTLTNTPPPAPYTHTHPYTYTHTLAAPTKARDSTGDRGEMVPDGGVEEDGKQARV